MEDVADAVGLPELKTDPRFQERDTRKANRKLLTPILEAKLTEHTTDYWVELLNAGVPSGEIVTLDKALHQQTTPAPRRAAQSRGRRHRQGAAVRPDREAREDAGRGLGAAAAARSAHGRDPGRPRVRPRADRRAQKTRGRLAARRDQRQRGRAMGMTVVQKILARASGRTAARWARCVEPKVDLAMSHENAALVVNQFLEIFQGSGREPQDLGSGPGRDHLRPPRAGRVVEDRHQPEERARVRRRPGHRALPRHPRRRGRHLPPGAAGERLRAARPGGGGHRLAHHHPRRARRLRVRHRRHRDGERLGARASS